MDNSSDEEEASSSRRNCSSPEDERPLKKARYLWQIKGNHHLKDKAGSCSSEDMDLDPCENNNVPAIEQASTYHSEETSENELILPDILPSVNRTINPSGYLIHRWQTKQITRGMLDNTMNCMMERMGFAPLSCQQEDPEVRRGDQIEDEAVMMAIQHHGLQCNEQDMNFQQAHIVVAEEKMHQDLNNFFNAQNNCESSSVVPSTSSSSESPHQALSQFDHDSFLAAAVAVAIQKKGLTSVYTDAGTS